MSDDKKIYDDIAALIDGAYAVAHELKSDVRVVLRHGIADLLKEKNFVSREDYDELKETLIALTKRVEHLEQKLPPKEKKSPN